MQYYSHLLRALDLQPKNYLLDYGCGKGKLLQYLYNIPNKIWAVDADSTALTLAKKYFTGKKFKDYKIEFKNISSPDQLTDIKFDKIICHNVLEYIGNKVNFIDQFISLLKDDGLLVLSHFDFDSAIYNSADKDFTRTLIHQYADHFGGEQKSDHQFDGQMGRKMPALLKKSIFKNYHWQIIRLAEDKFSESYYGYLMAQMLVDFGSKIYSKEVLSKWQNQLDSLNKEAEYFFAIDLFICVLKT